MVFFVEQNPMLVKTKKDLRKLIKAIDSAYHEQQLPEYIQQLSSRAKLLLSRKDLLEFFLKHKLDVKSQSAPQDENFQNDCVKLIKDINELNSLFFIENRNLAIKSRVDFISNLFVFLYYMATILTFFLFVAFIIALFVIGLISGDSFSLSTASLDVLSMAPLISCGLAIFFRGLSYLVPCLINYANDRSNASITDVYQQASQGSSESEYSYEDVINKFLEESCPTANRRCLL